MANNFEEILSNWQYVLPPSRPNEHELDRIKSFLSVLGKDEQVAVLGSTIEYRNLLRTMGFQNIYVFEKSVDFYNWTQSWIIASPISENVVWGDWLETVGLYCNKFALVLSDLTMGNIEYEKRSEFYQSIYSALKPGGVFFDKVLTHGVPHLQLDELIRQYENMPINLCTVNRFSCEVLFCSELLNEGVVDTTKFYKILRKRYTSPVLIKFIEKAHIVTPENCMWYYGKDWAKLEADYNSMYTKTIAFEDTPESPYYKRVKHFINMK